MARTPHRRLRHQRRSATRPLRDDPTPLPRSAPSSSHGAPNRQLHRERLSATPPVSPSRIPTANACPLRTSSTTSSIRRNRLRPCRTGLSPRSPLLDFSSPTRLLHRRRIPSRRSGGGVGGVAAQGAVGTAICCSRRSGGSAGSGRRRERCLANISGAT
ncbi:hypothetical protein DAI22_05g171400 [Oryza sativa Japonica Group]|nr:hypothetical protein DAI22_05g171400 [Oryza sativa Japonica Group]